MRASQTLFLLLWFFCIYAPTSFSTNVTYDHRALVIDGKRRVLVSGSIHYPRSTPEVLFITLFLCLCLLHVTIFSFVFEVGVKRGGVCLLQMWPDIIQKSKDGGLDVIETYVFWNLHEPVRGQVLFFLVLLKLLLLLPFFYSFCCSLLLALCSFFKLSQ